MKYIVIILHFVFVILCTSFSLHAQKPLIDTGMFDTWPIVSDPAISNDGKYSLYQVVHQHAEGSTLMINALNGGWKMSEAGASGALLTDDSRKVLFMMPGDSLCIQTLGSPEREYIQKVKSFSLFMQQGKEWLAYEKGSLQIDLTLSNLSNGEKQNYTGLEQYLISRDGRTLVTKSKSIKNQDTTFTLKWISLQSGEGKTIWEGKDVNSLLFDESGTQLAFLTEQKTDNQLLHTCWFYKAGTSKAVELANDQAEGVDSNLTISQISSFSHNGGNLFVGLQERSLPKVKPGIVPMTIWSYRDAKLQSQQFFDLGNIPLKTYRGVIHLQKNNQVLRLQNENDDFVSSSDPKLDNFQLIRASEGGDWAEEYWNTAAHSVMYLARVSDGTRINLNMKRFPDPELSEIGKYIIGCAAIEKEWDFWSYEIATGKLRNLTGKLPIPLTDNKFEQPLMQNDRGLAIACWLTGDSAVLIYDRYDIWQIDPSGKILPVRLTNGRPRKLIFRIGDNSIAALNRENMAIDPNEVLLLNAFSKETKDVGFYKLDLSKKSPPELLSMGAYSGMGENGYRALPIKARNANVWLLTRESATESPNIFKTTDFRSFVPVSDNHPEKKVNWLTAELINFKTSDGTPSQAVLYKPENFDPGKKYPLIIHYYDKKSDWLNRYWIPSGPNGELDIAWFVSHGYLVLMTDIHYKIQHIGESIYQAVVGAADYLSQKPYVDAKHIGIQGHSFGGYETNYLITHSKKFTAALTSSGMSDLIGYGGSVWSTGTSQSEYVETRNVGLAATPWDRPDLYVKDSPIFYLNNVTSPILMVQNKKDGNVSYAQGLELFTGLRRAGKRVWWLEYDHGYHGLGGIEYKDYVLRSTQFFDHYLKGLPAPKWMVDGMPARMKGVDDGMELEPSGVEPGPGLLTEERKKADSLEHEKISPQTFK
jgi:dipeptidyl aminopeptidase/acylaminoacyl peptidase